MLQRLFMLVLFMQMMWWRPALGIQCERISVPACQGLGYNMTTMPNLVGHNSQADAEMVVSYNEKTYFKKSIAIRPSIIAIT